MLPLKHLFLSHIVVLYAMHTRTDIFIRKRGNYIHKTTTEKAAENAFKSIDECE